MGGPVLHFPAAQPPGRRRVKVKFDISDPAHRAVLEAARAWGVAPSIFLGRERTSSTSRWAGTTHSVHSPEWTDDDRTAALDLQAYEASLCPGCRHPVAETTAPEAEERYHVPHPIRCHRCTATEQAQERFQDMPSPGALLMPVQVREHVKSGLALDGDQLRE